MQSGSQAVKQSGYRGSLRHIPKSKNHLEGGISGLSSGVSGVPRYLERPEHSHIDRGNFSPFTSEFPTRKK
jgi:hypothetical protein